VIKIRIIEIKKIKDHLRLKIRIIENLKKGFIEW